MNPNREDATSIKQDNGEGNHASTSDSQITDQDVDLGLTLPPSDLLFNTSSFVHDAPYTSKFAFPAQEGVIEETSSRELPQWHGIFDDDFYLEEPPAKRQRATSQNDPLPSLEDEAPSASNIQTRAPSVISDSGTRQSRSDSGYGISIAEPCENIEQVNDAPHENFNLSDFDAGLWGDDTLLDPLDAEFNPPPLENNEVFTINNAENITIPAPKPISQPSNEAPPAPPKPDVHIPSERNLPVKGRKFYPPTKIPKGFGAKKMSKADAIKMGASVGLFPSTGQLAAPTAPATHGGTKTSSTAQKPQTQKQSISIADAQNTMDLPLPLAISIALTEPVMRQATLSTIYRTQSAMLHTPGRPSQPPAVKSEFVKLLGKFYEKFEKQGDIREALIKFVLEKLEEGADDPQTVRPTMKWMTLEKDLETMKQVMKDITDAESGKRALALATGSTIFKRNTEHIKELVAGMPHLKSLEAKVKSQSKQIEALAAKCQEVQLEAQYRAAIEQASKRTEAPAPVRMPPHQPSEPTDFDQLPKDLVPLLGRHYRTSAPMSNTAWMCAHTDADSEKHCGAIMRSWIKHQQRGNKLWISTNTCVKCQKVHQTLEFKYFLHESEVQQLGGISQRRKKSDDSPMPANNPVENNHEPIHVSTPSPDPKTSASSVTSTQATSANHRLQPEYNEQRHTQKEAPLPVSHAAPIAAPTQYPPTSSITPTWKQKAQAGQQRAEMASQTPLHPAILDPRRASASMQAPRQMPVSGTTQPQSRRAPAGGLNIPTPAFAHDSGPGRVTAAASYDQPPYQYSPLYHQPPHQFDYNQALQQYYGQMPLQIPYGYNQIDPRPPHGSPYPPQHQDLHHRAPQQNYGPAFVPVQAYYHRLPPQPSPSPPRQNQPTPQAQRQNQGIPRTSGVAQAPLLPTAPTHKPADLATPPRPTNNRLKRPLPADVEIIDLDAENPSSSEDSQPSAAKRQCKSKPPKNPKKSAKRSPSPKPRTMSSAPIDKQTVETLRSLMGKGVEKSWMKNGGPPETTGASNGEREGASPSASQSNGEQAASLPTTQAAPPEKTRRRTKAAPKPTTSAAASTKKPRKRAQPTPKVLNSVEQAPAEEPANPTQAPTPFQIDELEEDQDSDNDSLFGDSSQHTDRDREMSDELADEWAKELEAEMSMTPEVIEESEGLGRELEGEIEGTPDGDGNRDKEESEEE